MADNEVDYHIDQDLEQLFHSDLQNLELGRDETNQDDIIGDHLPEWLVGVIVVIIMLIIAFFVMVITSLIKKRQKNRSTSYNGMGSSSSTTCDDLESGKIGNCDDPNMKMTSFTPVSEGMNGGRLDGPHTTQSVLGSSDHDPLTSAGESADPIHGVQGCRNPLFVDDEPDSDDNNESNDNKSVSLQDKDGSKDIYIASTSSNDGHHSGEVVDHGRSKGMPHKHKHSSTAKKSIIASKATELQEDPISENEGEVVKRRFASKNKSGNQTLSKRERIKSISVDDSVNSLDDESDQPGEGNKDPKSDSGKPKMDEIGSCCEDSGVETGPTGFSVKEDTAGVTVSHDAQIESISDKETLDTNVESAEYDSKTDGHTTEAPEPEAQSQAVNKEINFSEDIVSGEHNEEIVTTIEISIVASESQTPSQDEHIDHRTSESADENITEVSPVLHVEAKVDIEDVLQETASKEICSELLQSTSHHDAKDSENSSTTSSGQNEIQTETMPASEKPLSTNL